MGFLEQQHYKQIKKEVSIKKSLAIAGAVISIGAASVAGAGMAFAQTPTSINGSNNLVDKIAQKFNLNKSDVQSVFDENRASNQAEREQKMKDRLAQDVTDGKITQAQADLITAKHKELEANREANKDSFKNMSMPERKAAMKKIHSNLEQWREDNNIPDGYLRGGPGKGHPGPGHDVAEQ